MKNGQLVLVHVATTFEIMAVTIDFSFINGFPKTIFNKSVECLVVFEDPFNANAEASSIIRIVIVVVILANNVM